MIYRALADTVLLLHAAFVLFVALGGLLVLWKRWLMPWHLAAVAWGATVVGMGWICPLTPLENDLRQMAGQEGYAGGFIEHYVFGLIYPEGLTRGIQMLLAGTLVAGNAAVYALVYARRPGKKKLP
ncbi:DUF2784 domain-containing protein [Bordetella petrii]|uniref:DUF2784 domain-containing protein n=1 Tax=Bordetella petrii TaxID=94624 RepID=UPI001E532BB8|nr:DUF2784 domain-containing protein [Bordetella petrii]MCD0501509.1 DUF2784 domain-containing protein [Bordetella petrii]